MPHHNVLMFLRHDDIVLRVKSQRRGFALFMAGVAIKVRQVGFGANQFGVGLPDGSGIEELGINQGDHAGRWKALGGSGYESQAQSDEYHRQDQQHRAFSRIIAHEMARPWSKATNTTARTSSTVPFRASLLMKWPGPDSRLLRLGFGLRS